MEDDIYFAGIDIGSTMTKVAIVNEEETLCATVTGPTGPEHRHEATSVMTRAVEDADIAMDDVTYIVATGYGRINVPFADREVTELSCHARGVAIFFPGVRTAIDIGGQDAKGLKIRDGKLIDFVMNDKCAAGTGRFLEVLAATLGLDVKELGGIAEKATKKTTISNICTIFAKQEVISYLSEGVPLPDIIAGLCDAIAGRVTRMVARLRVEPLVVLTGGVAKNSGVVRAVEDHLGCDVHVMENPLLSGAIGAAIIGKEFVESASKKNQPIQKKKRVLDEPTFYR
jgi:predicted CoA-substrate-specific enzyme activase